MALDMVVSSRVQHGLRQLIAKVVTARHRINHSTSSSGSSGKCFLHLQGSAAALVAKRVETMTQQPIAASNRIIKGPSPWSPHPPARLVHGMMSGAVTFKTAEVLDDAVRVDWMDGIASHFNFIWLRVNCPSIFHSIGQRTLYPCNVDPTLRPSQVTALSDGSVMKVDWSDGHSSVYEASWLKAHDNSPEAFRQRESDSCPTPLRASDTIPEVDGVAFMEDDKALYEALREINRTGVCLLNNVDTADGVVKDVARRIAPISHGMLFGETAFLAVRGDARDVGFTAERLALHMDLTYYESPPGLQFLNCQVFDDEVKGGETIFLDAFAAAAHFRKHNPEMFEVLARVPVTFCKVRSLGSTSAQARRERVDLEPAMMEYRTPHFQLDSSGNLVKMTWAPKGEAVLMSTPEDIDPYYRAHRAFHLLIEEGAYAEEHTLRKRLKPGQCVIFNNRRLVHGREAFVETKESKRKLELCYVNIDDALNRYRSLRLQYEGHQQQQPSDNLKRVGNGTLIW